jgi:hypothetical protein
MSDDLKILTYLHQSISRPNSVYADCAPALKRVIEQLSAPAAHVVVSGAGDSGIPPAGGTGDGVAPKHVVLKTGESYRGITNTASYEINIPVHWPIPRDAADEE